MNKSCKIEEKYLFKQILVGILILLGELLIGRAANFPKILNLFQSSMNHHKSCTNKFLRHLKQLLNKTKRLAKTEYVQIPMFGGSCFLTLA